MEANEIDIERAENEAGAALAQMALGAAALRAERNALRKAARQRRLTIHAELKWAQTDGANYPGRLDADYAGNDGHAINGAYVHVQAFRVTKSETGEQIAWQAEFQPEVAAIQTLCGGGYVEQTRLEGWPGEWILAAFSMGGC